MDVLSRSPASTRKKHEKECLHRPCFCPDSGCSFTGTMAPLLFHFTIHHKWPSKKFNYNKPFDLPVKPGPSLLNALDDHLFLMNIEPLEPLGHAISLVCVQPDGRESRYGCSVEFSCFKGHNQTSTLEAVKSSSLLDGLPKEYFCIVPHASDRSSPVMLRTELVYDEVDDELEDESYDEDDEVDSFDDDSFYGFNLKAGSS
jgi:E3 ubiquitin-protein ligase SIAH1